MNVILNEMDAERVDAVEWPKKTAKQSDEDVEKDDDVKPPKKKAKEWWQREHTETQHETKQEQ